MRRTLIVFYLLVIVLAMATTAWALEPTYNVGLSETVETPSSWIATTAEFRYCGLFGFFSSTCGQKAIIFEGVDITMVPDLIGYRNIREIKLIARSTAGDVREFVVSKEDRKHGVWLVTVSGLRPAEWIFTWEIKSKDKTRTYGVLFFRFSKNGARTTGASIHVTVQQPPAGLYGLSPQIAFGYTRGLIEAWATPDPAYMAKLQMLSQQQPLPQPQPVSVAPPSSQLEPDPVICEKPQPRPQQEFIRIEKISLEDLDSDIEKGDWLIFKRSGRFVAEGFVTEIGRIVEIGITRGGNIRSGDSIFKEGK